MKLSTISEIFHLREFRNVASKGRVKSRLMSPTLPHHCSFHFQNVSLKPTHWVCRSTFPSELKTHTEHRLMFNLHLYPPITPQQTKGWRGNGKLSLTSHFAFYFLKYFQIQSLKYFHLRRVKYFPLDQLNIFAWNRVKYFCLLQFHLKQRKYHPN